MSSALMIVHIVAGSTALAAGGLAGFARKSAGGLHAKAGTAFAAAMLVMTATGALIGFLKPERGSAMIGVLTFYLVATSWMTARDRTGTAGRSEWAALPVALASGAALLTMGLVASQSASGRFDSLPAAPHYFFAGLAFLAVSLDLNFILRRRLDATARLRRHLWRMSVALFIAASSFFLGQQDEFPKWVQGTPPLYLPPLGALLLMAWWLVKLSRTKRAAPARAEG